MYFTSFESSLVSIATKPAEYLNQLSWLGHSGQKFPQNNPLVAKQLSLRI